MEESRERSHRKGSKGAVVRKKGGGGEGLGFGGVYIMAVLGVGVKITIKDKGDTD